MRRVKCFKKPLIIVATQWFKEGDHHLVKLYIHKYKKTKRNCFSCKGFFNTHGILFTPRGEVLICPSNWILEDTLGDTYSLTDEMFKDRYEIIEENKKEVL